MTKIPKAADTARRMYANGVAVPKILKATRLKRAALYLWIDGGPAKPDGSTPENPLPRRSRTGRKSDYRPKSDHRPEADHRPTSDRSSVIQRLWHAADMQVREIETRLGHEGQEAADRDRDARSLAVLARTLKELRAFDQTKPAASKAGVTPDSDEHPRDLDELRRSLASKLERIIAEQHSEAADEP